MKAIGFGKWPPKRDAAAVRWYAAGFALGAAGASVKQRKGRPRLRAMVAHWRKGIVDGQFAASMFVGAYAAKDVPAWTVEEEK